MMKTPATALQAILAIVALLLGTQSAAALPPAGLTQIRGTADPSADLAVIDGVAYASSLEGIYTIDSVGLNPVLVPSDPEFGPLVDTSRVVQTNSGDIFFLAEHDGSLVSDARAGIALYDMSSVHTSIAMWPRVGLIRGIDHNLRGLAVNLSSYDFVSFELFPDGTVAPLVFGPAADFLTPGDLMPNGTAIAQGTIAGTIGSGPAILLPSGEVEFLEQAGSANDIRERNDGNGINVSWINQFFTVKYGDTPAIEIDQSAGDGTDITSRIHVSESEFVVLEILDRFGVIEDLLAYYPGVNPAEIDQSVPMFDLFPELNTLDFSRVLDISSVDGQIHMLLSGNDGLWLFAAPAPSVVPEPSGMLLIGSFLAMLCASPRNRQRH